MKAILWFLVKGVRTALGFGPVHHLGALFVSMLFADIIVTDGRGTIVVLTQILLSCLYPVIHCRHSMKYLGMWRLPSKLDLLAWPISLNEMSSRLTFYLAIIYHMTTWPRNSSPVHRKSRGPR